MKASGRRGMLLLLAAAAAAVFAVGVALTGGLDTRVAGFPVRARSWERPALLALLSASLGLLEQRRVIAAFLRRADAPERLAYVAAWAAVCWAFLVALAFGTFAAGGADSYGYIAQAELFARGLLVDLLPRHPAFSWPGADATLTPLGFVPDGSRGLLVPQYPPGLPLLMAPLAALHSRAVFLVVPLCAAAAVLLCWRLGERLGEPVAGALAAVLLAASPTFLYQAVQPMSDVPVTAFWLAALLLAAAEGTGRAAASGVVASIALLIRPNLAPLLILVAATAAAARDRIVWSHGSVPLAAALPGLLALGAIQQQRFGVPLSSGYESLGVLFSAAHVLPNLIRYPAWMTAAHSPFIWIWILAPLWFRHRVTRVRRFALIGYAFAWAVVLAYLPYVPFGREEWSYSRFMLPALPFMLVLGVTSVLHGLRCVIPRFAHALAVLLAVVLSVFWLLQAHALGAFSLHTAERKFPETGAFVRDHLPLNASVFAMQHSGSLRYYSGRLTIRWDLLERGSLDAAVAAVRAAGYEPFVVLDPDEEPRFHARFSAASPVALDWLTRVGVIRGTRVYAFSQEAAGRTPGR